MVTGIESFKEWFKGNESQYAIIGGTACDILMTEEGLDFRATKDIDLVLIIEAVDAAFGRKFWDYVKQAGYEHRNKSSGMPQFYRLSLLVACMRICRSLLIEWKMKRLMLNSWGLWDERKNRFFRN